MYRVSDARKAEWSFFELWLNAINRDKVPKNPSVFLDLYQGGCEQNPALSCLLIIYMPHSKIITTPEGTPLASKTVGELVAVNPRLSRVFHQHNIGFCCDGGLTVRQACERKNLYLEQVIDDLVDAMEAGVQGLPDISSELEPAELQRQILEQVNAHFDNELPRIYAMADRVARVHGDHTPSLVQVFAEYEHLVRCLRAYQQFVADKVLPLLDQQSIDSETVKSNADCRSAVIEVCGRLSSLTNCYTPPPTACNTYRALFTALHDLQQVVFRHQEIEQTLIKPASKRCCE